MLPAGLRGWARGGGARRWVPWVSDASARTRAAARERRLQAPPLLPLPLWREPSFPAARLAVSMAPQRPQVSAVPRGRVQRGGERCARREERPRGGGYGYPQPRGWGRGWAFPPLPVPLGGRRGRCCGGRQPAVVGREVRSDLARRAAGARSVC